MIKARFQFQQDNYAFSQVAYVNDWKPYFEEAGFVFDSASPDLILTHDEFVDIKNPEAGPYRYVFFRNDSSIIQDEAYRRMLNHPRTLGVAKTTVIKPKSLINDAINISVNESVRYHYSFIPTPPGVRKETLQYQVRFDEKKLKEINPYTFIPLNSRFRPLWDMEVDCSKPRETEVNAIFSTFEEHDAPLITSHRRAALNTLAQSTFKLAGSNRLLQAEEWHQLLLDTKICVCPWGWGEFTYREWEAFFLGAVVIKPNSDFIVSCPNMYLGGLTYIPCSPDFSDLNEKIEWILGNWNCFEAMRDNNRRILLDFCLSPEVPRFFVSYIKGLIEGV